MFYNYLKFLTQKKFVYKKDVKSIILKWFFTKFTVIRIPINIVTIDFIIIKYANANWIINTKSKFWLTIKISTTITIKFRKGWKLFISYEFLTKFNKPI